jgi:hypothetical protein
MARPTPNPAGGTFSAFYGGVSCASATACTAVGAYNNTTGPLAERWNGTSWKIQRAPNPAVAGSIFYGVSCTSAAACTAVGDRSANRLGMYRTLAEREG